MGTEVTLFGSKLPAHLRAKSEALSSTALALMGSGGGGKRISMKNGVWRLLDNGKEIAQVEERYLDVVIIKAAPKVSRVLYLGAYDSANTAPPDCWSADGDTPDASIKEPQSKTCAKCEQNVAGSGKGNSRACRFQQRIAVVTASDLVENGEKANVMNFTVPATSLFGKAEGDKRPLQEYARWLGAQKVGPEMLVTRMKFDTSDETEGQKVVFKAMRYLEQEEFDAIEVLAESDDAQKAITMTVAQADGVAKPADAVEGDAPKPKAKAKPAAEEETPAPKSRAKAKPAVEEEEAPAPKAKAKPAEEDDDAPPPAAKSKAKPAPPAADEDETPAVRKDPKEKAETPKADLASVVDGWDD
jgi:hypothetical protein